jgi:apolipoprotein N-acyltransferase
MPESDSSRPARQIAGTLVRLVLGSLLLVAGFAPVGAFPLVFVGIAVLVDTFIKSRSRRTAFACGFASGLAFHAVGLHWLIAGTVPGTVVLCLYLSLFWGVTAVLIRSGRFFSPTRFVVFSALAWTSIEFVRTVLFGGFPWLLIGHTTSPLLVLAQAVDVTGVAGMTFLCVFVGVGLLQMVKHRGRAIAATASVALVFFVFTCYGWNRLRHATTSTGIRFALVQPDFVHLPGGAKPVTQAQLIDHHLQKSGSVDADVIVWSETVLPGINVEARTEPGLAAAPMLNKTYARMSTLARDRRAHLITGGYFVGGFVGEVGRRRATDIRNSVYHIDPAGELVGRYDKIDLVPFAEHIALRETWPWAHRQLTRLATAAYASGYRLTPGTTHESFELVLPKGRLRVATPICFEDAVAPTIRRFFIDESGSKSADMILNITNDGWFNSVQKHQHLQIARFRSIENRVPTARVSNTGISAFIDSAGRVVDMLDANRDEILTGVPAVDDRHTFYTRFGDLFAWACIAATSSVMARTFVMRRRR